VTRTEAFIKRSRGDIKRETPLRRTLTEGQNLLLSAVAYANQEILAMAGQNPDMDGMGTTLVGLLLEPDGHMAVVNIGDSRLYLIRDSEIRQITKDHTLVGEQERRGILTREEARKHPQRHILTRALGTGENLRVDVHREKPEGQDLVLICSDGLHDMLDDSEILRIVKSIGDGSLYKIGMSLVLNANLAGGMDNITVVLISFSAKHAEGK
jgi:protein phosphatase